MRRTVGHNSFLPETSPSGTGEQNEWQCLSYCTYVSCTEVLVKMDDLDLQEIRGTSAIKKVKGECNCFEMRETFLRTII